VERHWHSLRLSANITGLRMGKHWLAVTAKGDYTLSAHNNGQLERYGMSNAQPKLSKVEEQNFTSLGNILGILIGFLSPLIFWLIYRDRSKFLDANLKSALNFQLTMIIAYIAAGILSAVTFGVLSILYLAIAVLLIVFCIMAFVKTRNGDNYTYPLSIPFIK
jgi:uncharacterized Tic20 family protein